MEGAFCSSGETWYAVPALAIKAASEKAGLASTTVGLLVQCDRLEEALRLCDEIWRDGLQLPSDGTTLPKQVEVIRPGLRPSPSDPPRTPAPPSVSS